MKQKACWRTSARAEPRHSSVQSGVDCRGRHDLKAPMTNQEQNGITFLAFVAAHSAVTIREQHTILFTPLETFK
jgi:hypothetical protein